MDRIVLYLIVLHFCLGNKSAKNSLDAPPHFVCSLQLLSKCGRAPLSLSDFAKQLFRSHLIGAESERHPKVCC